MMITPVTHKSEWSL